MKFNIAEATEKSTNLQDAFSTLASTIFKDLDIHPIELGVQIPITYTKMLNRFPGFYGKNSTMYIMTKPMFESFKDALSDHVVENLKFKPITPKEAIGYYNETSGYSNGPSYKNIEPFNDFNMPPGVKGEGKTFREVKTLIKILYSSSPYPAMPDNGSFSFDQNTPCDFMDFYGVVAETQQPEFAERNNPPPVQAFGMPMASTYLPPAGQFFKWVSMESDGVRISASTPFCGICVVSEQVFNQVKQYIASFSQSLKYPSDKNSEEGGSALKWFKMTAGASNPFTPSVSANDFPNSIIYLIETCASVNSAAARKGFLQFVTNNDDGTVSQCLSTDTGAYVSLYEWVPFKTWIDDYTGPKQALLAAMELLSSKQFSSIEFDLLENDPYFES